MSWSQPVFFKGHTKVRRNLKYCIIVTIIFKMSWSQLVFFKGHTMVMRIFNILLLLHYLFLTLFVKYIDLCKYL